METIQSHGNETILGYRKPYCYTTVAWRTLLSSNQNLAIGITNSLTILPSILLNSAYCYALFKTEQLKKKSKLLVFLQSVSDFFFGAISIPMSVILFAAYGNTRCCWLERVAMFIGQTNGHISLYLLMLIAMQRYFVVRPQLGSSRSRLASAVFLSFKGLKIAVMCIVSWSTFTGLVSVYFFGHFKSTVLNITVMVLRSLFALLTYIFYFRLYFSVKKHQRKMTLNKKNAPEMNHFEAVNRKYRSCLKTVSLVLIANAVSYVPVLVADCWTGYYTFRDVYAPQMVRFSYYLVHFTLFLNCSLNTAIFLYRDGVSRAFLRRKLCGDRTKVKEIQPKKSHDLFPLHL